MFDSLLTKRYKGKLRNVVCHIYNGTGRVIEGMKLEII